jgi:hypothetical protein
MKYKHYLIGRKGFVNIYKELPKRYKLLSHILRYKNDGLWIWEFKYKTFGFDIGFKI